MFYLFTYTVAQSQDVGGLNNFLSFALGTTPLLLGKIWGQSGSGRQNRYISRASRTDSSGSEHLLEQENPMHDSDSAGGVIIHTSFRYLHRAAAQEFAGDL